MKRENIITILVIIFVVLLVVLYIEARDVKHTKYNFTTEFRQEDINNDNSSLASGTGSSDSEEYGTDSVNIEENDSLIVWSDWGVKFSKPSGWNVIKTTNNKMMIEKSSGGDIITVEYIEGDQVQDSDAKFGNVTYYYDPGEAKWMRIGNPVHEGIGDGPGDSVQVEATIAIPISYTKDALPIFNGTGRWRTVIIPLSHTRFIKVNIGGSGNTQPLDSLVTTIDTNI